MDERFEIAKREGAQIRCEGERVEVMTPQGTQSLALRPINELYGSGTGESQVDPKNEAFTPLFLRIEEDILGYWKSHPKLTDAQVLLTLKQLGMSPEEARDELGRQIQLGLRMILSLNNYSRQEVRGALRRLVRSVELHSSMGGVQGYLNFVAEFFKGE